MDYVLYKIKDIASKYDVEKVVLFGSRARGDNSLTSDYDIAVFDNKLSSIDKAYFTDEVESIETLKKIDIIFINEKLIDGILKNVKRDGITIYEQT